MMKLACTGALLVITASCGSPSKPAVGTSGGKAGLAGDFDGDGAVDDIGLADGVVTVGTVTFKMPSDFIGVDARAIELGGETVIVVESEVVEDDLQWRVLRYRDGALLDLGSIFLGNAPDLATAGVIKAHLGNCGQSTDVTYRLTGDAIEKHQVTTGVYDVDQCSACPYVFVDAGAGLAFVGESLRNLSSRSKQTEDSLALPALSGQRELTVVLAEVKAETTFLDAIAVDFDGTLVPPRGCAGAACSADDDHETFTMGERRRFVFDVPAGFTGVPTLRTRGYYEPFAPTVAR